MPMLLQQRAEQENTDAGPRRLGCSLRSLWPAALGLGVLAVALMARRSFTAEQDRLSMQQNQETAVLSFDPFAWTKAEDTEAALPGLTVQRVYEEEASEVLLPVTVLAQYPELPNGCEITSATMVLNYLGFSADKTTMAETYLPKQNQWTDGDPNVAYMGDPAADGWYCYAGPVVAAVNDYLADAGAADSYRAVDLTGATAKELRLCLQSDLPVVFWATLDFEPPITSPTIVLADGEALYTNLHCMVLTGYDGDTYYVADPLEERQTVDAETFEEIYTAMGSRAMVIEPIE